MKTKELISTLWTLPERNPIGKTLIISLCQGAWTIGRKTKDVWGLRCLLIVIAPPSLARKPRKVGARQSCREKNRDIETHRETEREEESKTEKDTQRYTPRDKETEK